MKKYSPYIFIIGLFLCLYGTLQVRPVRWDMTDDKRYSLSESSKHMLRETDAPIEVIVLLGGDLNAGFTRLKKATEETLEEMGVYSELKVSKETKDIKEIKDSISLHPIVIHEREQNGRTAQTTVYPYALMRYKGRLAVVPLLRNTRGLSGEENLNASIEQLEFAFMEALHQLQQTETPRVAIIEGHGEPDEAHTYDLMNALSKYFQVDRGSLAAHDGMSPTSSLNDELIDVHILDGYKAIIIASPRSPFSEQEKYVIDQYIMRGGTVLWLIDGVQIRKDILREEGFTPVLPLELGLTEMLFRYGVRVNPAIVQDLQCLPIPVNVSSDPEQPNLQPVPWTYAPLLLTSQGSPITKNLGQVMSTFVSPIDAVGGEDGIEKRVLLATSTASRITPTPGEVDLNDINPDHAPFKYEYVPVAVSMEGTFQSVFAHRIPPEGIETDEPVRKTGCRTRQVVVASGSIIMNEVQQGRPLPMGYDRYSGMQFSNRDFAVNAVLWLTDSDGLISLREKTVALRLLNDRRAHDRRATIQTVSTVCPIAVLALIGGIVFFVRKHQYAGREKLTE